MKQTGLDASLLEHLSLEEVAALINARDDVREMVAAESEAPVSSVADTIPLPSSTTAPPKASSTLRIGVCA